MMYRLSPFERETIIRWDAEAHIAIIDTAEPVTIRKLDALVKAYPDAYRCVRIDKQFGARQYEVASRYIRFAKPVSDARRTACRKNLDSRADTVQNSDEKSCPAVACG